MLAPTTSTTSAGSGSTRRRLRCRRSRSSARGRTSSCWTTPLAPHLDADPGPRRRRPRRRAARAVRPLVGRLGRAERRSGALLAVRHDRRPATASPRYLFPHRADLAAAGGPLAPMEPFSFTARDGLTVHGYLDLPARRASARGPARGPRRARRPVGPRHLGFRPGGAVAGQPRLRLRAGELPRARPATARRSSTPGTSSGARAMQDDLTDAVDARRRAGLGRPGAGRHLRRLVRRLRGAGRRRVHPGRCTAAASTSSGRPTCSPCSTRCPSTGTR